VLRSFIEHLRLGRRPALATVVKTDRGGPAPGTKMIVLLRGTTEGSLGAISSPVAGACLRVLAGEDRPGVFTFGGVEVYIEAGCSPMKLVIAGAGHIGWNLARMAGLLGFAVTVMDDRPSFANRERFPDADNVIAGDFVEILSGMPIDDQTSIVLVTRGHRHDEACLKAVVRSAVAYIGMIGSRRRVRTVLTHLRAEGFPRASLERIWSPIGLDLGAESPAEIALSILAEILKVRNVATGRSMKDRC
jgi:xanthine dehydrogenase accessory factor